MKKITICFEFRGGKGHAYVNIIPSNYSIYKQDFSGCHDFRLPPGAYQIMIEGVSPAGGAKADLYVDDVLVGTKRISEGYYSRYFRIQI